MTEYRTRNELTCVKIKPTVTCFWALVRPIAPSGLLSKLAWMVDSKVSTPLSSRNALTSVRFDPSGIPSQTCVPDTRDGTANVGQENR